ncbi:MAG: transposase [Candidatus Moranbacteria bacterium]|nr:transposase [Candidatus Moranbacteria bacterium]
MDEFNTTEPIGSIYAHSFSLRHPMSKKRKKLVNFICYCINPNHYHFILEQIIDGGIERFMQKLGDGYTKYFNYKEKRSGSLFQGRFKSTHINSNEYLLHLSSYVNLNNRVHKLKLRHPMSKSSWEEHLNGKKGFCKKKVIAGQFKNCEEYKKFAENSLAGILERKGNLKEMEDLLME